MANKKAAGALPRGLEAEPIALSTIDPRMVADYGRAGPIPSQIASRSLREVLCGSISDNRTS
jgi:hypothetical protein